MVVICLGETLFQITTTCHVNDIHSGCAFYDMAKITKKVEMRKQSDRKSMLKEKKMNMKKKKWRKKLSIEKKSVHLQKQPNNL
jgi:hypothetical protein